MEEQPEVVCRGSKGKETGEGLGERVEWEVLGKSTEDVGSRASKRKRKERVQQCNKALCG